MAELGKLSHSRLMLRTKYYRDKTLNLEKQVQHSAKEIESLKYDVKMLQEENGHLINRVEELKAIANMNEIEKLQCENNLLLKKLEQISREQHENQSNVNEKINEYEQLLSEIQKDIITKEQELDYYKSKVKSLEKNNKIYSFTSAQKNTPVNKLPDVTDIMEVIAYFDYSLVKKTDHEWIVFGDFHIKNFGSDPFVNPSVCFRFSPPEATNLKGKILSVDQAAIHNEIQETHRNQWMFLQSNWAEEAKERGEIWIAPTTLMRLSKGETVTLQSFQIPVTLPFSCSLIVEGFVYSSESDTKIKSSNNISMTY
ncbi:hypothetical protein [Pueribacillus sp. YX66]|uniref:hypothetical protein n=1 Tax=Pueribacillus sp. YX66 TaxID=3229242 RepID=UPI00358D43A5